MGERSWVSLLSVAVLFGFSTLLYVFPESGVGVFGKNVGLGLLGYIAGEVHGGFLADAVRERVFEPLCMTRSVVGVPDARTKDVAACHVFRTLLQG